MPFKHYNQLETTTFDDSWITTISNSDTKDVYQVSLALLRDEIITGADISPASVETSSIENTGSITLTSHERNINIVAYSGFVWLRSDGFLTLTSDSDQINIKAEGEGNIVNIPGVTGAVRIEDGSMSVSGDLTAASGINVSSGNVVLETGAVIIDNGGLLLRSGSLELTLGDISLLQPYTVSVLQPNGGEILNKLNDPYLWITHNISIAPEDVRYDYRGMYESETNAIRILKGGLYVVSYNLKLAYKAHTGLYGRNPDVIQLQVHELSSPQDIYTYVFEDTRHLAPEAVSTHDYHLRGMGFSVQLPLISGYLLVPKIAIHVPGDIGFTTLDYRWDSTTFQVMKVV